MKKTLLAVSVVLAQMLTVNAFAQSKGEADPAGAKALPVAPATAQEKATAKAARKQTGAAVAKSGPKSDDPHSMGVAKKTTKEERKAAAAKRKAATAEAVKKGQIPAGEK